eukprot:g7578.t1
MRPLSRLLWPAILLASRAAGQQVISFNRTAGEVEVGTCEGLKKNAELGIDISVVVTANLRCAETITVPAGVHVSIGSAADAENYLVAIAEDFAAPDPASVNLLVNPEGSRLSLDRLIFANEAGSAGSTGAARAVWNRGTLDVNGCVFAGLNFASLQDGGAIYSTAEPGGTSGGAFVSVHNSTFEGNVAENRGGAIASVGEGEVELSNCTFVGNEAVGAGDYRRAGSGGAVYASAGVFVTVLNSSFEGCLGRYGGAALFACGANIFESTFDGNEATGLFGAVVNGDLSDEERVDATMNYGAPTPAENYTCPPLFVSGTLFDGNVAVTGYGGAIASVDSSLSVFNSSMVDTFGGALYFGTSADDDRDQLEMELIQFNLNEASSSSPNLVGSAFLLERTGTPVSNTTGPLETVELPASSSSSAPPATVQQSVGGSSAAAGNVGVARDIYCFQNSPYDCEAYFGGDDGADIAVQLAGTFRCNACKGAAFTGMGSAAGAPVPAPVDVDDDDGLSQMGQERAQGGTPSPVGAGTPDTGDTDTRDVLGEEQSEPDLLGATGGMRWVVVGLIVGIGGALLVCMCLVTVCRSNGKRRTARTLEALDGGDGGGGDTDERGFGSGEVIPAQNPFFTASVVASDTQERGFGSGRVIPAAENPFFATSSITSAAANVDVEPSSRTAATTGTVSRRTGGGSGRADLSRSSSSSRRPSGAELSRSNSSSRRPSGTADTSRSNSRRPSATGSSRPNSRRPSARMAAGEGGGGGGGRDPRRDTSDSAVAVVNELTPQASERRNQELARQRSIEMTVEDCWGSPQPPLVSAWGDGVPVGGAGHVALSAKSTPTKQGFTALQDEEYQETKKQGSRSLSREQKGGAGEARPPPYSAFADSADAAADAASRVAAMPRGRTQQERGRGRGSGSISRRSSTREAGGSENPVVVVVERRLSKSPDTSRSAERGSSRSASHSRTRIKPPSGTMYGSPLAARTTADRALARAVKTPAGGARLSISAASTPGTAAAAGASKGNGQERAKERGGASGKNVKAAAIAAAVAGAADELESSGDSKWHADATVVSSEENPVYSHDRSDVSGSGKRSNSRERGAFAVRGGAGGWAAELYRFSPAPKKDRSAKVHSGKFDANRSDWSADGEVEWSRYS